MPEIEITIDTQNGSCRSEIKGIRGSACEKTAREVKRLFGDPAVDEKTAEYYLAAVNAKQIIRGGNG